MTGKVWYEEIECSKMNYLEASDEKIASKSISRSKREIGPECKNLYPEDCSTDNK